MPAIRKGRGLFCAYSTECPGAFVTQLCETSQALGETGKTPCELLHVLVMCPGAEVTIISTYAAAKAMRDVKESRTPWQDILLLLYFFIANISIDAPPRRSLKAPNEGRPTTACSMLLIPEINWM